HSCMVLRSPVGWRGLALALACGAGLWLAGAAVTAARAAPAAPTLMVNNVSDAVAAGPLNDGVCDTVFPYGATHTCTLRAAVMKANHWPGGGVTIRFATALNGAPIALSIPPAGGHDETKGDLNIFQTTHLIGNGAGLTIIDAANANDRVFLIESGAVVDMSG